MNRDHFFSQLWTQYTQVTPQALLIHKLLKEQGEEIRNDHVAFRTFNRSVIDLNAFEYILSTLGYKVFDHYHFPNKHLDAIALKSNDDSAPKIFVSELKRQELSSTSQEIIENLLNACSIKQLQLEHLFSIRPWPTLSYQEYSQLAQESEYAAWLATMGLRANHFTVAVNTLESFQGIKEINRFLLDRDFPMNHFGGLIKGSPSVMLEQSSTLADRISFDFSCGVYAEIPSCFYEFAYRHTQSDGNLFQGFVTNNAKDIFESTHR